MSYAGVSISEIIVFEPLVSLPVQYVEVLPGGRKKPDLNLGTEVDWLCASCFVPVCSDTNSVASLKLTINLSLLIVMILVAYSSWNHDTLAPLATRVISPTSNLSKIHINVIYLNVCASWLFETRISVHMYKICMGLEKFMYVYTIVHREGSDILRFRLYFMILFELPTCLD